MSNLEMTVELAYKIAQAFSHNGWTELEVERLSEGTLLANVLRVVKGHAFIETKGLVIDCDADPYIPSPRWTVKEHRKDGILKAEDVIRSISGITGEASGCSAVEMVDTPYNANVLFHLYNNQHLVPKELKGKRIVFRGTTYWYNGGSCVVYLHEYCSGWSWEFFYVPEKDNRVYDPTAASAAQKGE